MLVTALDEFHAGRMIEVGDILSSRMRMLTTGIERGSWKLARHFLVYHTRDAAISSEAMVDEALKIEEKAAKRSKRMTAAGAGREGPY